MIYIKKESQLIIKLGNYKMMKKIIQKEIQQTCKKLKSLLKITLKVHRKNIIYQKNKWIIKKHYKDQIII